MARLDPHVYVLLIHCYQTGVLCQTDRSSVSVNPTFPYNGGDHEQASCNDAVLSVSDL